MAVTREITLRYRAPGHVRFQVPEALCTAAAAAILEARLRRIEGVYRATVYRRQGKLSIRYLDMVVDLHGIARQMLRVLDEMAEEDLLGGAAAQPPQREPAGAHRAWRKTRPVQWFREKFAEAKETLQAFSILAKHRVKRMPAVIDTPEKAVIEFLNDVLVFYLIKLHWPRITQEWVPHPIRHRYQWLALSYLTYLLVRARRSSK